MQRDNDTLTKNIRYVDKKKKKIKKKNKTTTKQQQVLYPYIE